MTDAEKLIVLKDGLKSLDADICALSCSLETMRSLTDEYDKSALAHCLSAAAVTIAANAEILLTYCEEEE